MSPRAPAAGPAGPRVAGPLAARDGVDAAGPGARPRLVVVPVDVAVVVLVVVAVVVVNVAVAVVVVAVAVVAAPPAAARPARPAVLAWAPGAGECCE